MTTNPSRTNPVMPTDPATEAEHYRRDLLTGKRYGLIIRQPVAPDASCDEAILSCTAYGFRINPPLREETPTERRTILSSCDLDDHHHL